MDMTKKVFLTDERRQVINGNYDGNESTEISHRANIKNKGSLALEELTEIAESPHIDHIDVFDSDDVHQFLRALLTGTHPDHLEGSGVIEDPEHEKYDDLPENVQADYSTEFENYQNAIRLNLAKLVIEEQTE